MSIPTSQVRPFITVTHAAFDASRRTRFAPLRKELEDQCVLHGVPLYVHEDREGKGSLGPWFIICQKALEAAEREGCTHLITLPDDAILVPHFVEVAIKAIAARPNDVLCHQSNMLAAILPAVAKEQREECALMIVDKTVRTLEETSAFPSEIHAGKISIAQRLDRIMKTLGPAPYAWYSTPEGATLFGGTIPLGLLREHLAWREEHLLPGVVVQADEGVNLWCLDTDRLIYKSLPSLVDHDLELKSLDCPDMVETSPRKSVVFDASVDLRGHDWSGPVADLGLTYTDSFWRLIFARKVEKWSTPEQIEKLFTIARGGDKPVTDKPKIFIASPCYGGIEDGYLQSRDETVSDLETSGAFHQTVQNRLRGESLITKARQISVHLFLQSKCTHLFFWDADVECMDPSALRTMVGMGYDVVGCAYPFKNGSGMVVANMLPETIKSKRIEWDDKRMCCAVREVGTGFLLISRAAILRLCAEHPELLYKHQFSPLDGRAVWAIFDTAIVDHRYLSEDWNFCRLWRELGEKVWLFAHPRFRHWGKLPGEGHILDAWGLRANKDPENRPSPNPHLAAREKSDRRSAISPEKRKMPDGSMILHKGSYDENGVHHPEF